MPIEARLLVPKYRVFVTLPLPFRSRRYPGFVVPIPILPAIKVPPDVPAVALPIPITPALSLDIPVSGA